MNIIFGKILASIKNKLIQKAPMSIQKPTFRSKRGCFEEHLYRITDNPLFPHRVIKEEEINKAQKKDDLEYETLHQEYTTHLKLPAPDSFTEATEQAKILSEFVRRGAAAGGNGFDISQSAFELRESLFQTIINSTKISMQFRETVKNLRESLYSNPWEHIPFFAQLMRPDSPMNDCLINSVLSESFETWKLYCETITKNGENLDELELLKKAARIPVRMLLFAPNNYLDKYDAKKKIDYFFKLIGIEPLSDHFGAAN